MQGLKARRMWAALIVLLVPAFFVATTGLNAAYTRRVAEQSEMRTLRVYQDSQAKQAESHRALCELFTILDDPAPPPTTERGKQIQKRIHDVRKVECGGR